MIVINLNIIYDNDSYKNKNDDEYNMDDAYNDKNDGEYKNNNEYKYNNDEYECASKGE